MQINYQNITETEQELHLKFSKDEIFPLFKKAYQEVTAKAHINGFRPGKAPLHLIKKLYGESIEMDELSKLADQKIPEVLQQDKVHLVSTPHLHDIKRNDGGVEFVVHYHYIPEFELKDYKGLTINEPSHVVTESEVEEIFEDFLYSNCPTEQDDMVTDKNYKIFIYNIERDVQNNESEIDNVDSKRASSDNESLNTNSKENVDEISDNLKEVISDEQSTELSASKESDKSDELLNNTLTIYLRDRKYKKDFVEAFIGKRVGDIVEYSTSLPEKNDETTTLKYEIRKIEKLIPHEPDEEFIKKASKDRFSTEDDFRKQIELDLQARWDREARNIFENNLITSLVDLHDIKLPDFIVLEQAKENYKEFQKRYNLTDDKFDEVKDIYLLNAANSIKWSLIKDRIIETENIQVEDFDLHNELDKLGIDENQHDVYFNYIKENKQFINSILVRKVMDFIIDFTTTNEVEFTEEQKLVSSFSNDFDDDYDDEEEEDDIFDADEEFIDEEEFDDEFFDDEDFDDDEFDDFEELDDEEDEDEEEDDDEFDDDEASKK